MSKTDPLLGPKLKLARAKSHLRDFEAQWQAFAGTEPYELVSHQDPKTGEEVYAVRIHKCIPGELSVIVGDVVHNLRSALDQLVCGLIRANGKQVSGGNGFPIGRNVKGFEKATVSKLKNLPANADRFIRRLKPYNGGNDKFWLIGALDNMDKHNDIVPVAAGQAITQIKMGVPGMFRGPSGQIGIGNSAGSEWAPLGFEFGYGVPSGAKVVELLHDSCELYRSRLSQHGFPEDVQVTIKVTFGKTEFTDSEPIVETLTDLIKLVERTIDIVKRRIL